MPCERTGPVAGVVLAAGMSSRMGQNKLLVELDGQSMLRHVTQRAIVAQLDPVIVVLGHEADRLERELADLACQTVINPDFAAGMGRSLGVGLAQLPQAAPGAVVLLADMPLITSTMIRALVTLYRGGDAPLVVSSYGDVHAPPILFDRTLLDSIDLSGADKGARDLVAQFIDQAVIMEWPVCALADLDSPLDYERIVTRLMVGP